MPVTRSGRSPLPRRFRSDRPIESDRDGGFRPADDGDHPLWIPPLAGRWGCCGCADRRRLWVDAGRPLGVTDVQGARAHVDLDHDLDHNHSLRRERDSRARGGATPVPPPTGPTVSPPQSVVANCSVDVSKPLRKWLKSLPAGQTVVPPANACYLVNEGLKLVDPKNLTIYGATFMDMETAPGRRAAFQGEPGVLGDWRLRPDPRGDAHRRGELRWLPSQSRL